MLEYNWMACTPPRIEHLNAPNVGAAPKLAIKTATEMGIQFGWYV